MAYRATYSGDPDANAKDAVRFLIGDTDSTDFLLSDKEIEFFLIRTNYAVLQSAIRCCETIMTKFARMCDESVGSVKITFSQRYKAYQEMIRELQRRLATDKIIPYAGGISRTDVQQNDNNPDRIRPDFTKHMMENQLIAPWTTDEWGLFGDQPPVD